MLISKTIGSSVKADITINGRYVSEMHGLLIEEDGEIFIEDLDSTFGTRVNGKPISHRTKLISGDLVKLGTQIFHWSDHIGEAEKETNPIYFKDLFLPAGLVNWADYKIILLVTLGLALVVPLGVPMFMILIEQQLTKYGMVEGELVQYAEPITIPFLIVVGYVFFNLTLKAIRKRWR